MAYNYTVTSHSPNLDEFEVIMFSDTTNSIQIEQELNMNPAFFIKYKGYVALHIENPENKRGDAEYDTYVVIDENDTAYRTSSLSFFESLMTILDKVSRAFGNTDNIYLKIYRIPCKNYDNKFINKCSLVSEKVYRKAQKNLFEDNPAEEIPFKE